MAFRGQSLLLEMSGAVAFRGEGVVDFGGEF